MPASQVYLIVQESKSGSSFLKVCADTNCFPLIRLHRHQKRWPARVVHHWTLQMGLYLAEIKAGGDFDASVADLFQSSLCRNWIPIQPLPLRGFVLKGVRRPWHLGREGGWEKLFPKIERWKRTERDLKSNEMWKICLLVLFRTSARWEAEQQDIRLQGEVMFFWRRNPSVLFCQREKV